ncbi:MAG: DUF6776 family protein [Parahaliea sp.]
MLIGIQVAALLLAIGAVVGQQAVYRALGVDWDRYREVLRTGPETEARISELNEQLAAARTRHDIDRAALELVRKELARQRERIADLDEGLRFYRGLMAPGEIAQGFSLRGIELLARKRPRVYAYRIIAQQEARKHETVRGELKVSVLGTQNGQSVSYPLSALAEDVETDTVSLRFRYFQLVEGELNLPPGFTPQTVEIQANLSKPDKLATRQTFPWQLRTRFTAAGK